MAGVTVKDLAGTLERLQAQMAEMVERLEALEKRNGGGNGAARAAVAAAAPEPAPATITEEEMLAISAAIAAYLGVRAHIRQVRLLSTSAWAQQGRVSIQASHMLQG
jgi:methylmalonyl-CoA carboxyltransferase large subunit